ncbi:MAG: 4Fe-4S binding protein [Coriobacteriaceae bacterium]|nr:4Fe-4S binding protein [Coriobacteriaceae bacterium]
MAVKMLVDLERCIGCWTCSMACKMGWKLEDDVYRVIVQTHGSGAGIDRPQGQYPSLHMSWQPLFEKSCTFCAPRVTEGLEPHCSYNCPTKALAFGDPDDPTSDFSEELNRCRGMHYALFEMPNYAQKRGGIIYAKND